MARIWRDGQKKEVHIYRLLTAVSKKGSKAMRMQIHVHICTFKNVEYAAI